MTTGPLPQIVNFTVMVAALGFFARKPLKVFLEARSQDTKKLLDEAEKESKEIISRLQQATENVAHQKEHATKLKEDAKAMLARHRERILETAKKESARIVKDGELLGQGELQKKKEALEKEISEKSLHLAEKYLGDQLEAKDKEKLVSEYIGLVGHGKA